MKIYKIAYSEGDGIGPEIVKSSLNVLDFLLTIRNLRTRFEFTDAPVGWKMFKSRGTSLPEESLRIMESSDGLILGPLDVGTYPLGDPGAPSPSGKIRKKFDLFANIRPTISFGLNPCYPQGRVNLVVVRENTEGFYADRNMFKGSGEFQPSKDLVMSLRVVSRLGSTRIIKEAFDLARRRRKKVTAIHKGNVLKITDGFFLDIFHEIASTYPDIAADDRIIDAAAYDLVKIPERFDVIVTTNMYGDILSDEAAGIAGSLGIAPSLNSGENYAMAQAVHGSAPDIAGKGISNPLAEIMSSGMLLDWLGKKNLDNDLSVASHLLDIAVWDTLRKKDILTPDLGGTGNTDSVEKRVIASLEKLQNEQKVV